MYWKRSEKEQGFTLLEFLVALAVGSIVTAVIYMAFTFQQKTWVAQDQLASMQQGLRMSLRFIAKDLMLAGYYPERGGQVTSKTRSSGTVTAGFIPYDINTGEGSTSSQIEFTMDLGDATGTAIGTSNQEVEDPGEHIRYYLNGDQLCRGDLNGGSGCDVVAENIEDLRFYYFLDDGTITSSPTKGKVNYTRYVRVVILARTEALVTQGSASQQFTYIDQPDKTGNHFIEVSPVFNDNRRRLMLAMNVQCRNMGL